MLMLYEDTFPSKEENNRPESIRGENYEDIWHYISQYIRRVERTWGDCGVINLKAWSWHIERTTKLTPDEDKSDAADKDF